ncbi:hypothetical protein EDC04DRAFT_2607745 [Pisolithus marmoratus]|nr:hypothetical protein EDC04DRAFT_2607745 [Pisolithus marmoratus]
MATQRHSEASYLSTIPLHPERICLTVLPKLGIRWKDLWLLPWSCLPQPELSTNHMMVIPTPPEYLQIVSKTQTHESDNQWVEVQANGKACMLTSGASDVLWTAIGHLIKNCLFTNQIGTDTGAGGTDSGYQVHSSSFRTYLLDHGTWYWGWLASSEYGWWRWWVHAVAVAVHGAVMVVVVELAEKASSETSERSTSHAFIFALGGEGHPDVPSKLRATKSHGRQTVIQDSSANETQAKPRAGLTFLAQLMANANLGSKSVNELAQAQ